MNIKDWLPDTNDSADLVVSGLCAGVAMFAETLLPKYCKVYRSAIAKSSLLSTAATPAAAALGLVAGHQLFVRYISGEPRQKLLGS